MTNKSRKTKSLQLLNEKFAKLTNAQKRVEIAKDVIKRVNSGQYKSRNGTWVDLDPSNLYTDESSIQNALVIDKIECQCCALGSLMLSCVAKNNKLNFEDIGNFEYADTYYGDQEDKTGLHKFFTENQIRLIEIAFERGRGLFGTNSEKEVSACGFANKYVDTDSSYSNGLLITIMENIIANNGTFVP